MRNPATVVRLTILAPTYFSAWIDLDGRRYSVKASREDASVTLWQHIYMLTHRRSSWNGTGPIWARLSKNRADQRRPALQDALQKHVAEHGLAEVECRLEEAA